MKIGSENGTGIVKLAALSAESLRVMQIGNLSRLEVYSDASRNTVHQDFSSPTLTFVSPGNNLTVQNGKWSGKAAISVNNVGNLIVKNSRINCNRSSIDAFLFPKSDCVLQVNNVKNVELMSTSLKSVVFDTSAVEMLNFTSQTKVKDMMWKMEGFHNNYQSYHKSRQRHCNNSLITVSSDSQLVYDYESVASCIGDCSKPTCLPSPRSVHTCFVS